MERSKIESLNVRMRHGDDCEMEWETHLSPGAHLSHSVMCKESNEDDTKETLQTNKQRALTSLQVFYSHCENGSFEVLSLPPRRRLQ